MELHLESFPLVPLIDDVAKTIEPMATKSGNRIVIACRPELWGGATRNALALQERVGRCRG